MTAPAEVRVRMYNVGFGDCFLLTFSYAAAAVSRLDPDNARTERHILFDFGTMSGPRSRLTMKRVAEMVASDSGSRLDAIVISHRHKDHISAFASAATTPIIAGLDPLLVVRPWTENPRLQADAGRPPAAAPEAGGNGEAAYLSRMHAGERLAERIVRRASAAGRGRASALVQLAEAELRNASAVAELDRLSAGRKGEYMYAGRRSRLNDAAPGVSVRIVGPPKPRQWPPVTKQARRSDEFWLAAERQIEGLFRRHVNDDELPPGTSRWIIDRLRRDEQRQVAAIVRWLDDVLNNTSLILLIEVGQHKLLFGGDAQVENWGWALQHKRNKALREALAQVTLYKVGHHGSRNATPVSLYHLWESRQSALPLVSMMSTKADVHGSGSSAVPRSTLIDALRARGALLSTDDGEYDWLEARAELPAGQFEFEQGSAPP